MRSGESRTLALCIFLAMSHQARADHQASACGQTTYSPDTSVTATLAQVEQLRQRGQLQDAYDQLLPWLQSHGENPRIVRAMARLYDDSGEHAQARRMYRKIQFTQADMPVYPRHRPISKKAPDSGRSIHTEDDRPDQGSYSYANSDDYRQRTRTNLGIRRPQTNTLQRSRPPTNSDFRAKMPGKTGYSTDRRRTSTPAMAFPSAEDRYPYDPYRDYGTDTVAYEETDEPAWVKSARADLQALESQITTSMLGSVAVRSRSGGSDLEKLTDIEIPLNIQTGIDYERKIGMHIRPVSLSAEEFSATSREGQTFGSLPLTTANPGTQTIEQDEEGIALAVYYQDDDLTLDAGVTPLGFPEQSIVGGIDWQPQINDTMRLQVDAERRAMKNSLLTYAGTVDPRTGEHWGGVTQSGARIGLSRDEKTHGVYGGVGYYFLQGSGVKDNNLLDLNGGAYWKVHNNEDYQVTIGTHLMYQDYEHNLRHFTLGHGGYFSPQRYMSIGLPAELAGQSGDFSYRLTGLIGAQYFEEDAAPVFPRHSGLQRDLETLSLTEDGLQSHFDGNENTSLLYSVSGEFEYSLSPYLALGGWVRSNNANDFNEHSVLAYLRYSFDPQAAVSVLNRPALNGPFSEIWY